MMLWGFRYDNRRQIITITADFHFFKYGYDVYEEDEGVM